MLQKSAEFMIAPDADLMADDDVLWGSGSNRAASCPHVHGLPLYTQVCAVSPLRHGSVFVDHRVGRLDDHTKRTLHPQEQKKPGDACCDHSQCTLGYGHSK